jgi:NitT/TauT family transport system ATP-binding protein
MNIKLNHITKSFGETSVLKDFSCTFEEGVVTCIMGTSGGGKTTLLRLLMGLEIMETGCITGLENKKISAVFQEDRLLENLTAPLNIQMIYPRNRTSTTDTKALDNTNKHIPHNSQRDLSASTRSNCRPNYTVPILNALRAVGLSDDLSKPVREFSGGMKRRVAIVRALLADYDILILDEPFKGLDDDMKLQVMNYVKESTKNKTVIMVTHDKDEVQAMGASTIIEL